MANSFQGEAGQPELASVSELAENLVYRLPGCTDIVVRKTIREVYREFCRETQCLTAERRIPMEKGVLVYPVYSVFGGIVESVRRVCVDNLELVCRRDYSVEHGDRVVLHRDYFYPGSCRKDGDPEDGSFHVDRIHTGDVHIPPSVLRVVAVETPKLESEKTPSWFIQRHGDAIVNGVLSKLSKDDRTVVESRVLYENAKSEERMRQEYPAGRSCIDTSMIL